MAMTMKEAMGARHTVRKYMDKPLPEEIVKKLKKRVSENNEAYGLAVELRTNDASAINALVKVLMTKGVKNFFVLSGADTPGLNEKLGECGADLMLYAQTLGLNTWWAGGVYNKGKLNAEANGNKVIGVIAVGYGSVQGTPHKSKTYADVATYEGEAPDWFKEGVRAALLAPTAMNKQDFTITGKGRNVRIRSSKEGAYSGADLGIVKYHFEVGAGAENFIWDK